LAHYLAATIDKILSSKKDATFFFVVGDRRLGVDEFLEDLVMFGFDVERFAPEEKYWRDFATECQWSFIVCHPTKKFANEQQISDTKKEETDVN
jgi:hypothetical protein